MRPPTDVDDMREGWFLVSADEEGRLDLRALGLWVRWHKTLVDGKR
jgi:hypothetical protein